MRRAAVRHSTALVRRLRAQRGARHGAVLAVVGGPVLARRAPAVVQTTMTHPGYDGGNQGAPVPEGLSDTVLADVLGGDGAERERSAWAHAELPRARCAASPQEGPPAASLLWPSGALHTGRCAIARVTQTVLERVGAKAGGRCADTAHTVPVRRGRLSAPSTHHEGRANLPQERGRLACS